MANYLTDPNNKVLSGRNPLPVDDVTQASDRITVSSETVTFNCGAKASSTGVNALDKAPILNLAGDKIGSYWGIDDNIMYVQPDTSFIGTLTETALSAAIVLTDVGSNLELLFEIASGNRQYVLRAIDSTENELYGWIGGVAASGNEYTLDIHNAVTGGAQSWVGTLLNFDNTNIARIEIYSYESSFTWGTGTVLTEEVAFRPSVSLEDRRSFFDNLTAGQYAIDYQRGGIYFKKATTGTSDTANYNSMANAAVSVSATGGTSTLVDDSAFGVASSEVTPVGYLADESATDSVGEGDVGAARITLDRRQVMANHILDDAALGVGTSYVSVMGGFADETSPDSVGEGDVGAVRMSLDRKLYTAAIQSHDDAVSAYASMNGLEAKDFDGSALPNNVAEGDIARVAGSTSGVQYMMLTTEDGAATPLALESTAISAANGGTYGLMQMMQARDAQKTAVSADEAVRPVTLLTGEQIVAGYSYTNQNVRVGETDPVSAHHVESTLADVSNETNATTYYYVDMDGYRYLGLQIEIGSATDTCTVTLEGTLQDDGTAPSSCTYQDVTVTLTGVASTLADAMWLLDTPMPFKYLRVKTVTAGGNNDADYTIYAKKLF